MVIKNTSPIWAVIEKQYLSIPNEGNYHARNVTRKAQDIHSAVSALEKLAKTKHPGSTDDVHFKNVSKATQKAMPKLQRAKEEMDSYMALARESIIESADKKAGLMDSRYSSEIRATVRGMSNEDKTKTLTEALRNNDSETIYALCASPSVTTGISKDTQLAFLNDARKKLAPNEMHELEVLNDSEQTFNASLRMSENFVSNMLDDERLQSILNQESEAESAAREFNDLV